MRLLPGTMTNGAKGALLKLTRVPGLLKNEPFQLILSELLLPSPLSKVLKPIANDWWGPGPTEPAAVTPFSLSGNGTPLVPYMLVLIRAMENPSAQLKSKPLPRTRVPPAVTRKSKSTTMWLKSCELTGAKAAAL